MGRTPRPSAAWALCLLMLQLARAQQDSSPQFSTIPSNTTAYQNTSLPCTASGTPPPTISWYKDGVLLNVGSDSRLTMSSAGLQLSGLNVVNGNQLEGAYQCQASNSAGSVTSLPATLTRTVWEVGFTTVDTGHLSVPRFSYQTLPCRSPQTSVPQALVTWTGPQRNSNGVGVAKDGSLVFSAYNPTNQLSPETYSCTITNPVSRQSVLSGQYSRVDYAASEFVVRAAIEIPPVGQQTIVAGGTLVLECFTSGNPVPTVSWSRDGSTISAGGRVQLLQSARQLQISGVELSDASTYTCTAAQDSEVELTAAAVLHVIVPPRITSSFPEVSANVTQSFSVSCSSEGTPPLEWVWLHDATPLSQSERVTYSTSGGVSTLSVTDLEESARGVYQCVVLQPATGRRAAHNQLIDVRVVPPMFLPPPSVYQDRLVVAGSSVTLPCEASGFPTPTFQWRTNLGNNDLRAVNLNNARYSIPAPGTGDGSLTIVSTVASDSNTYVCQAMNSDSQSPVSNSNIILRVNNQPITDQAPPTIITPNLGDDVTLPCAVESIPGVTLRYRWTKNGAQLGAANRMTGSLVISSVREGLADSGNYTCSVVLTVDGISSAPLIITIGSTILTAQGPPQAPTKPLTSPPTEISHTSFTAHWSAPTDTGRLPVVNYTLEVRTKGSDFCLLNSEPWVEVGAGLEPSPTSRIVNRNVFPGIGYEYRVTVFTALFRNTSDPSLKFTTPNSAPLAPPSNVMAISLSSSEIRITWTTPTSCLMWGGSLTGYFLSFSSQTTTTSTVSLDGSIISHTLSNLLPATRYNITVAARNRQGVGVVSDVVMATTMEVPPVATPPPPPFQLANDMSSSNSTSVSLTWAPPTSPSSPVINYTIKYIARDGTERTTVVPPTQRSLVIGGLSPGFSYTFRVRAVYEDGSSSDPANITVTLNEEVTGILSQLWFYAVVAGGGAVFLVIATVLIVCICCQCCKMGNYNVNVKRATSGVSNASSNFTQYQRKARKRGNNTPPRVTVHQSPTPSRRSTDYAVPNTLQGPTLRETQHQQLQSLQNQFPPPPNNMLRPPGGTDTLRSNISSTCPPSVANFTSSAMSSPEFSTRNDDRYPLQRYPDAQASAHQLQVRGNGYQFDPYRVAQGNHTSDDCSYPEDSSTTQDEQSPYLDEHHMTHAEQLRRSSATATQTFQDTLQRVHTPPMSSGSSLPQFGSSYLAKTLSDDTHEPPWNPGEFVNARGNMSGNMEQRTANQPSSKVTADGRNHVSHQSKSKHKGDHMINQLSGPIGRSESLLSTESSNSLDYRGPSQLGGDTHQQMAEVARYQCPTPQTKRARIPYEKSHNFGDSYLTRADEIRMEELKRSRGDGQWAGEETDGYPSGHAHNRNLTHEERDHPFHQGAVPVVISYGPQVHMSHSTAVHGSNHAFDYDSDPPYAVPPPPRQLQQQQQQLLLSQNSVYQHPPPSYAAPPPPDDNVSPPPPPLHSNSLKRGTSIPPSEQRLHILPLATSLATPIPADPQTASIRTNTRSTSNSSLKGSHSQNPASRTNSAIPVPVPVPPPFAPVLQFSVPAPPPSVPAPPPSVPAPPRSIPAQPRSVPAQPRFVPAQARSVPAQLHSVPAQPRFVPAQPQFVPVQQPSVPVPVTSIPVVKGSQSSSNVPSNFSLQKSTTSSSLSHQDLTTPTKTLANASLLESSSSSSISSNWSIDHMDRHFEKIAKSFNDMLSPLDEKAERTLTHIHEGSEGVDWDTPTGPHMINGRGHTAFSKPHKPPVAQKPHLFKKNLPAPVINGLSRGYRTGNHNYNSNNHGYSADEEDPASMTTNKKRLKVPDPSIRVDPRQPVLKVKKVQGSAWRPVPINKAIESSSEDSDDSYCSDDTVVAKTDT